MLEALLAIVWWSGLIVALLIGLPIYILCSFVVKSERLTWLRIMICRLALKLSGQTVTVYGKRGDSIPENDPYLYMFNHTSLFDAFIAGVIFFRHVTAVAKREMFSWPLWGLTIRRYGLVPIDRDQHGQAIDTLKGVEKAINQDRLSVIILPEGTRSNKPWELELFKRGPFHVALNTQATIIPIAIGGAWRAKHKGDWKIRGGQIVVCFCQPITAEERTDMTVDALADLVRERIRGELKTARMLLDDKI